MLLAHGWRRGRAEGQSRPVQASDETGPSDGPASGKGHPHRHALQHRKAGRHQAEMKMRAYIALIHKDPHSEFGVSFPDFPGCISAGASLDAARANAEEVLAFHVEGMAEDGEAIPEPSSLEDIMAEPDN